MKKHAPLLLKLLLIASGATCVLAVFPMMMPLAWMDQAHQRLGLGPLPAGPVFEYLARTIAGLYAMLGGVMILAGTDIRRHWGLITYLGIVWLAFGVAVAAIDAEAGLPQFWTIGESAATIAMGAGILLLQLLGRGRT